MSSDRISRISNSASAEADGNDRVLVNTVYRDRYEVLLKSNLPPAMQGFAAFFANLNRLRTMSAMLEKHVGRHSKSILNAGSGAFAAELFSVPFQNRQITSFDYTPEFADLYPVFQHEGLLATTAFARADANTAAYPSESFDLIVFHDIFYETALNIPDVLSRFAEFLRPGGFVYLDFMNQKTAWLWRLIGKERKYRRYTIAQIRRTLEENGFDLLEMRRSCGASNPVVIGLNFLLWTQFRTSNAFAVVARKTGSGGI